MRCACGVLAVFVIVIAVLGAYAAEFDAEAAYTPGESVWAVKVIDDSGNVGSYTSMDIDDYGKTHISYYDWDGKLKYATNAEVAWNLETVDSSGDVGLGTSIVADEDCNAHIGYFTWTGALMYATNADGAWAVEEINGAANVSGFTSIVVDSSRKVHIVYSDWNSNLRYISNALGSWNTEVIDTMADYVFMASGYTSVALDSEDRPHICYYDFARYNKSLKYASRGAGDSWNIEIVDVGGDVGSHCSIAVDSEDVVGISYYDFANGSLKYATNLGGGWSNQTVDDLSVGYVGLYSSLVFDSEQNAYVSYYEWRNGLRLASNSGGEWAVEIIDGSGDVGGYTSIAIDMLGNPRISYFDFDNTSLKYAFVHTSPIAEAGDDQQVFVEDTVTFDGSGTSAGSEAIASYTWTFVDGDEVVLTGISPVYDFYNPGEFTVVLTVEDVEGFTATDTVSITVLDNVAPSTDHAISGDIGSNDWYVSWVNVTLLAEDAHSSLEWTKYRMDSGSWSIYSEPILVNVDGAHTVEYYSMDEVGNAEDTKSVEVKVDRCAPVLSITSPIDGTVIESREVTVSWSCEEECSGLECMEYSIDGSAYQSCGGNTSVVFTDLENGNHSVTLKATDAAGNAIAETVTFSVSAATGITSGALALALGAAAVAVAAAIIVAFMWTKKFGVKPEE